MINVCIRIRPLIFYVNICCFVVEHYSKKLKSFSLTDIPEDAESENHLRDEMRHYLRQIVTEGGLYNFRNI